MKDINNELVEKIVKQVLSQMNNNDLVKTVESKSGVLSIKGSPLNYDRFDTGNPNDQVYIKDMITSNENQNLAAGIMEMKESEFEWTLKYDEVDYIIEGRLDIKVNGEVISGCAGDLIMIPANTTIRFSVKDFAKFVYVTYPANWADL